MNTFLTIYLSLVCTTLHAQELAPLSAQAQNEATIKAAIEAAHIDQLFSIREKEPFELAVVKARVSGIRDQVILEATFLYHIDLEDYKAIAKISEQFEAELNTFDPDISKVFSTKQEWQSVIEYGKALKALETNDLVEFKKHITEAFWLSPDKANAFSHHITKIRVTAAMKKITLAPECTIRQITDDKQISLKAMLKDNDALILRYWSPWNQQADNTFFSIVQHVAQVSAKNKISFASILLTPEQQGIDDAKDVIAKLGDTFPSYWLADSEKNSLAKKLRVSDLPTLIIISKEGKILYNGSPLTDEFWNTLKTINPDIKAPVLK